MCGPRGASDASVQMRREPTRWLHSAEPGARGGITAGLMEIKPGFRDAATYSPNMRWRELRRLQARAARTPSADALPDHRADARVQSSLPNYDGASKPPWGL